MYGDYNSRAHIWRNQILMLRPWYISAYNSRAPYGTQLSILPRYTSRILFQLTRPNGAQPQDIVYYHMHFNNILLAFSILLQLAIHLQAFPNRLIFSANLPAFLCVPEVRTIRFHYILTSLLTFTPSNLSILML